jgi:hypothetical protein
MAAQHKVVADISTESGKADFSGRRQDQGANATRSSSIQMKKRARFLREPRSGSDTLIGRTTCGPKSDRASGRGQRRTRSCRHYSCASPPSECAEKFKKRFNYACDTTATRATPRLYHKHVSEKIGKFDSKPSRAAHGIPSAQARAPNLMEATWADGDIDRTVPGWVVTAEKIVKLCQARQIALVVVRSDSARSGSRGGIRPATHGVLHFLYYLPVLVSASLDRRDLALIAVGSHCSG